ncbi:Hypothetical Protein PANA_3172 [Pantoea ananatis LMG 20103]|uniref:Secreted protein n=1 Tax=Pantoea ananatis (strain LMG 20103) TaxID=706191 RepID=D4GM71_PANAM|nr:Hypothetical Protein PANA_3172 [Pantoea ananatis LMG 20103]
MISAAMRTDTASASSLRCSFLALLSSALSASASASKLRVSVFLIFKSPDSGQKNARRVYAINFLSLIYSGKKQSAVENCRGNIFPQRAILFIAMMINSRRYSSKYSNGFPISSCEKVLGFSRLARVNTQNLNSSF